MPNPHETATYPRLLNDLCAWPPTPPADLLLLLHLPRDPAGGVAIVAPWPTPGLAPERQGWHFTSTRTPAGVVHLGATATYSRPPAPQRDWLASCIVPVAHLVRLHAGVAVARWALRYDRSTLVVTLELAPPGTPPPDDPAPPHHAGLHVPGLATVELAMLSGPLTQNRQLVLSPADDASSHSGRTYHP